MIVFDLLYPLDYKQHLILLHVSTPGEIRVEKSSLLDFDLEPRLRLVVSAISSSLHAYATLWVNLTDINDNAPRFSQSRYVSAIWENNQAETYVMQVRSFLLIFSKLTYFNTSFIPKLFSMSLMT